MPSQRGRGLEPCRMRSNSWTAHAEELMTRTHQLTLSFLGAASLVATAALASGGLDSTTTRLTANLSGANEVPGPGDTDGKGKATFELEAAHDKICYKLKVEGIDEATM